MTYNTYKKKIHDALVEIIKQGIFLPVAYDPDNPIMFISDEASDAVPPASVAVNETECTFGLPERNRRERKYERGPWSWQAVVKFNREVVAEVFEEELLASPILIESDRANNLRQVTVILEHAGYVHPPRQGSSSGTRITYDFQIRLGPI